MYVLITVGVTAAHTVLVLSGMLTPRNVRPAELKTDGVIVACGYPRLSRWEDATQPYCGHGDVDVLKVVATRLLETTKQTYHGTDTVLKNQKPAESMKRFRDPLLTPARSGFKLPACLSENYIYIYAVYKQFKQSKPLKISLSTSSAVDIKHWSNASN